MRFLVLAEKRSRSDALRAGARAAHLEFMISQRHRVLFGGALRVGGDEWGGMALVLEMADESAVRTWLDEEPYHRAGVFGSVRVFEFDLRNPEPEPGWLARELAKEGQRGDGHEPARRRP